MKIGPLVYLLTLVSPLRLAEEICILDHLSNGRLEVGVGRGVSPFELAYHKVDRRIPATSSSTRSTAVGGADQRQVQLSGPHYSYKDVPMAMRPLQQPHPAFWYGSSNTTGAAWSGEHGMHFVANGPTDYAKVNIDAFMKRWRNAGNSALG